MESVPGETVPEPEPDRDAGQDVPVAPAEPDSGGADDDDSPGE